VAHGKQARHERHGMAKLTKDDVREIRRLLAAGDMSQTAIAAQFKVNPSLVSRLYTGDRGSWAGVE